MEKLPDESGFYVVQFTFNQGPVVAYYTAEENSWYRCGSKWSDDPDTVEEVIRKIDLDADPKTT